MSATTTTNEPLQLFSAKGSFIMPTDEQINALDDDTKSRFEAVKLASAENDKAREATRAAEKAVADAMAERDDAEKDLRRLRPKLDPVAVAKAHIAANRAQLD